jgi:hypothetical protein
MDDDDDVPLVASREGKWSREGVRKRREEHQMLFTWDEGLVEKH